MAIEQLEITTQTATDKILNLNQVNFAGVDTSLYYKSEDSAFLSWDHYEICNQNNVVNPYYLFTDKGEEKHTIQSCDLEISFGRIGAFSSEEVAMLLQEQASNYVHQDTMGKHFPVGNIEQEKKLLAEFMGGFDQTDVLVMVTKKTAEGVKPVAGSRVTLGKSNQTLMQAAKIENENATISTFQSVGLDLEDDTHTHIFSTIENDTVCLTRVFQQAPNILKSLEVTDRTLPVKLSAIMPVAYVLASQEGHVASRAIFDTHLESLIDLATKYYGGTVVGEIDKVHPKPAVKGTMIGFHYENGGEDGGYKGKIKVASMSTEDYLIGALDRLNKLGVSLDGNDLDALFNYLTPNSIHGERIMFEKLLNMQVVKPMIVSKDNAESQAWAKEVEQNALVSTVDHRLDNARALFTRFNPSAKKLGAHQQNSAFLSWIKELGLSTDALIGEAQYLFVPQGVGKFGDERKIRAKWERIAIMPDPLYRMEKEASAAWMMDSPDKATVDGETTRDILWNHTEVIALGCSVGSQIIDSLAALNIQHITLVDKNDYDGIVQQRMANPNSAHQGLEKAVKMALDLQTANPKMHIKTYTELFTKENADEILTGQLSLDPDRRLIIVEEVDDADAKVLARKKAREIYQKLEEQNGKKPSILLMMISDEGRSSNGVHVEVIGEDEPFNGTPTGYNPNDLYAENFPTALHKLVAMVGASQGAVEKDMNQLTANDIGVPIEMISALTDLVSGKVGSFLQSPVSARQSGVIASAVVLAWIEGHLRKDTRNTRVDLARELDDRYQNPEFLTQSVSGNQILEKQLYNHLRGQIKPD